MVFSTVTDLEFIKFVCSLSEGLSGTEILRLSLIIISNDLINKFAIVFTFLKYHK